MKVAVIGLGKLGAPLAAVLARVHAVVGVDLDPYEPIPEPGLAEAIARGVSRDTLTLTTDYAAIADTDVSFIVVPTPSDSDGAFSSRFVAEAVRAVTTATRNPDHVICVVSTLSPGTMALDIAPLTIRRLVYAPVFIALGQVIDDLTNPDFLLIGAHDLLAGDAVEQVWSRVAPGAPVRRTNWIEAEIAKIAVNAFVTMKISFANLLSEICEKFPGADVDAVTRTVGADRRIGARYLRGGLGYGGPCFPRDGAAFAAMTSLIGVQQELTAATDVINEWQVDRVLRAVWNETNPSQMVAVLGLSYKSGTTVTEASQGVEIAKALSRDGFTVFVGEPPPPELRDHVETQLSAAAAVDAAGVVVLALPDPDVYALIVDVLPGKIVIDPWRIVPAEADRIAARVVRFGIGV